MKIETPPVDAVSAIPSNQAPDKHLRGSVLLLAGRVIAMAANFAIQVLIVRYLSKSDYGAFAYAISLASLGSSFVVFGLDKTITRFLPIYQEKGEYHKMFGAIIIVVSTVFSLGFFLVLLVFGLKGWISTSFVKDPLEVQLLLLLILLSPIQALDSLLVRMLAIFVSPSAIFFRRHVLDPGLKLFVIFLLIFFKGDVKLLSMGFVAAGALGVILYFGILIQHLRNQEFSKHFNVQTIQFPIKEIFSFSVPLLTSNFVFMARSQLVIVLLGYFGSSLDVASFRAVQPVGDLNTVVIQSFAYLFMPSMARMFARGNQKEIDDLYWQSAVWIMVLTFPIFLVTFSLAEPLTLLLYGERYAQSGSVMALLAFGYYFNAALGFNADTLRVYGQLRYTVAIDFLAMLISLGLSLILIPRYGAMGAAIATSGTLIVYNILNHLGLKFTTKINLFQRRYLGVYLSIMLSALGLAFFESMTSVSIYIEFFLAVLLTLLVLIFNWNILKAEETFPELMRFKIVRRFLPKAKSDNSI